MEKQLRRIKQGAVLGGVARGLAEYFKIDVVIIRLLFVISLFISFGASLFAYIILWVALPEATPYPPYGQQSFGPQDYSRNPDAGDRPAEPIYPTPVEDSSSTSDRNIKIVAIGLIAIGTYILLDQFIAWYQLGKYFWPMTLIGVGAFLLLRKRDQEFESGQPDTGVTPPPASPNPPSSGWSSHESGTAQPDTEKKDDENSGESFKVN